MKWIKYAITTTRYFTSAAEFENYCNVMVNDQIQPEFFQRLKKDQFSSFAEDSNNMIKTISEAHWMEIELPDINLESRN